MGKVTGEASVNTLVNLVEADVLTREWVDNYLRKIGSREGKDQSSSYVSQDSSIS